MNPTTTQNVIPRSKRAAMKAGLDRRNEQRRHWRENPLLQIGAWRLWRLDDENFVVSNRPDDETSHKYYLDIESAIRSLLRERIHEDAKPGIQCLLDAIKTAKSEVIAALKTAGFASESLAESYSDVGPAHRGRVGQ